MKQMTEKRERILLWDLDGTLTESGTGIINSVLYALKKNNILEEDRKKLEQFVGPPLSDSFRKWYGMTQEQIRQSIEWYREYYVEKGMFENKVYEGIPQMLRQLSAEGYGMLVATSKPEEMARKILNHFELDQWFSYIGGAAMDETRTKKEEVISYVLAHEKLLEKKDQILMIGDRKYDVEGAAKNNLCCLGVLYGYGSREELLQAGAAAVCEKPNQLSECIARCFKK